MKKLIAALILILSAHGVSAQAAHDKSGALLWKISGNGLEKPSYVLGTLHLKPGAFLDSIPGAREALAACGQVVGELVLGDMTAAQAQVQQAMMMGPDTTYRMLYPQQEDYTFVSERLAAIMPGANLEQMGMLKPAAIDYVVSIVSMMRYFPDLDPNNLLDGYIQAEGAKNQKPVIGLEGVQHQIDVLFNSKSLRRQAEALLCNLRYFDAKMEEAKTMIGDYSRGDLNALYALYENPDDPCPAPRSEKDALLKGRNDAWMVRLPATMKAKPSFIAVGALHLTGKEGILNQLEQAGYRVEPVK